MKKRRSDMNMLRVAPVEERQTLITCEDCAGVGQIEMTTHDTNMYRMRTCIWCDGTGFFDRERQTLYRRWKRIRNHNMSCGLCR